MSLFYWNSYAERRNATGMVNVVNNAMLYDESSVCDIRKRFLSLRCSPFVVIGVLDRYSEYFFVAGCHFIANYEQQLLLMYLNQTAILHLCVLIEFCNVDPFIVFSTLAIYKIVETIFLVDR